MADRPSQKALSDFVSEAQEIIEALDTGLARLDESRGGEEADPDALNAVFRAAHSLKGLAAMFGIERMTKLAHALEDRLDDVRMGRKPLDRSTSDLLLQAPPLFSRMIAEESAREPPSTGEGAETLASRLRGAASATEPAPGDLLDGLALDPAVRGVLTEYEEHRLRTNLARSGVRIVRARAAFDLATFDKDLDALKTSFKGLGEVISTLPASGAVDPSAIAFEVLVGSSRALEELRAAAPGAQVDEVPRRGLAAAAPSSVAPPAERPPPAAAVHPPPAPAPALPTSLPVSAQEARQAIERGAASAGPGAASSEPGIAEGLASLRSVSQAVRVDISKLDRLMNLVGELVLAKTSLLGIAERLRAGEHSSTVGLELQRESRRLERKLNELQGGILEVRMVPIGPVFDKLSRMVRKLARDLGKSVELEVRGGSVELDKLIVESLSDPLMHLIRNAIDHAIEPPDARLRAGKPPAGRVVLEAEQKGNHVLVTVEDDGAGMDDARIRAVALERGLVTPEAVSGMGRREILNLIFLPSFSTARQVTALSGRGVGMDVVKSNIAAMSGIIDLHTELGRGTRFEITLPTTLAIIRALVVRASERIYAVPLSSVLEIVTVERAELRTLSRREVITLRGATLPIVRLGAFLGRPSEPPPGPLFVAVVGLAQERLGLAVDGLEGQQDIVVKGLGRELAGVRGISGATDLGNRRTVLVLDVGSIIEEVLHRDGMVAAGTG